MRRRAGDAVGDSEEQPLLRARVRYGKTPHFEMARDAGDGRHGVGDQQGAVEDADVAHALQRVRGAGGHLSVDETLERRILGLDSRVDRDPCEDGGQRHLIPDKGVARCVLKHS